MNAAAVERPLASTYPMLTEMGVLRFHEISHYTLRQDGPKNDVLKVHYKRRKGSFLPVSRRYTFGRALKTILVDGGTARLEDTFEISPYLLDAVAELDRLVAANRLVPVDERRGDADAKAVLLGDLDTLGARFAGALPADDAADFRAAIANLARRIDAL